MSSAPESDADAASDDHASDDSGQARSSSAPEGGAPSGGSRFRRKAKARRQLPVWQETFLLVGTAIIVALLIKTFLAQAFYIPSGSMRETLKVDDRILVQKISYWFGDVARGDIVVFDDPANWLAEEDAQVAGNPVTKAMSVVGLYPTGGHLVKRVIGVAGDTVACAQGVVSVNGVPLDESDYVTLPDQACTASWTVEVPDDRIWVMGDNREHSADSRAHTGDPGGGFIPVDDIVGKVFVIVWPADRWEFLHRPGTFNNAGLDDAAGLISGTAPAGLALIALPSLYRRLTGSTKQKASLAAKSTP